MTVSQIYDGPRPEWLREILDQLPNLQSLVVTQLPFFDHLALLALSRADREADQSIGRNNPAGFPLRLLIAANCQNTTAPGLVEALTQFHSLIYLDLSKTLAARDRTVLSKLRNLPLLQTLKLRGVHLRDEDVTYLANAIGTRVRSLDISENHLTDHSVRTLLTICFNKNGAVTPAHDSLLNNVAEDWPSGFMRPDPATLDEFRHRGYDRSLFRRLTTQIVSRLPFEDLGPSGITHLFVADNDLSVEGLAALIRSKRLYVLDAGTLDISKTINRPRSNSSNQRRFEGLDLILPGVEKLVPFLDRHAKALTSLRIDHSIVTEVSPNSEEDLPSKFAELSCEESLPELEAQGSQTYELDATPPVYELGSAPATPRYELPGDALHVVVSPAVGKRPQSSAEELISEPRKGSVFAPEVVEEESGADEESVILTATGLGRHAQLTNGIGDGPQGTTSILGGRSALSSNGDPALSKALIQQQRKELRDRQQNSPHGLVPGMLPNLRTIVLTQVPSHERTRKTVDALMRFIQYCASEAELVELEARFDSQDQRRTRGGRSAIHQVKDNRNSFALQCIILELAQSESSRGSSQLSPNSPRKSKFMSQTMSSTEDADSEALWKASQHDFTFFDDEEECGLPAAETYSESPVPSVLMSEKFPTMPADAEAASPVTPQDHRHNHARTKIDKREPIIDVVQELSKFRKERKAAFEDAMQRGIRFVDGYWPGEVKVIRGGRLNGPAADGTIDYYGNYFEKTGVYR